MPCDLCFPRRRAINAPINGLPWGYNPGTPRDFAKTTLKVHHSPSHPRAGVGTNAPTPRARKNVKILSVFSSNAFFICKYELYSIYIQLSYIPNVRTTQL